MTTLTRRTAVLSILSAGAMSAGMTPALARVTRPAYVDLSANQTPIKNQGHRPTCITFAALAALEAAYNRAGYGNLDFSEEFLNHFGKMFRLNPKWDDVVDKGEDGLESQIAAHGYGDAVVYLHQLSQGLHVPIEA